MTAAHETKEKQLPSSLICIPRMPEQMRRGHNDTVIAVLALESDDRSGIIRAEALAYARVLGKVLTLVDDLIVVENLPFINERKAVLLVSNHAAVKFAHARSIVSLVSSFFKQRYELVKSVCFLSER